MPATSRPAPSRPVRGRRVPRHLVAWVAVALVLAGCGGGDEPVEDGSPGSPGLANPASQFCVDQGGTVEIVDEEEGQVGICVLPDGTRVEEWEYYREQAPSPSPS